MGCYDKALEALEHPKRKVSCKETIAQIEEYGDEIQEEILEDEA